MYILIKKHKGRLFILKKAIIGSSLAAVIGLTGLVGGHNSADAAENTNHNNLVQLAQSGQAGNQAVQKGAYDYKFNENGMDYHLVLMVFNSVMNTMQVIVTVNQQIQQMLHQRQHIQQVM